MLSAFGFVQVSCTEARQRKNLKVKAGVERMYGDKIYKFATSICAHWHVAVTYLVKRRWNLERNGIDHDWMDGGKFPSGNFTFSILITEMLTIRSLVP